MTSHDFIQENAKLYLTIFEQQYKTTQIQLKELENKLNLAASRIQKQFRLYCRRKQFKAALLIQKWCRKIMRNIKKQREILNRFAMMFHVGRIQQFWRKKKHINNNHQHLVVLPKQNRNNYYVCGYFPNFIKVQAAVKAQISYIGKLRVYETNKFEKQWSLYEHKLKQEMQNRIKKKWVKKTKYTWINQFDKQVNAEQYISKQIDRLYSEHYNKHAQTDERWFYQISVLQGQYNQLKQNYYYRFIK